MNTELQLKYKSETGNSPFFETEANRHTEEFDSVMMEGMSANDIRDLIDYDCEHNVKLGVFIEAFPNEWIGEENLLIPSIEYVEWLEEKLIELQMTSHV